MKQECALEGWLGEAGLELAEAGGGVADDGDDTALGGLDQGRLQLGHLAVGRLCKALGVEDHAAACAAHALSRTKGHLSRQPCLVY